jgi:glutamate synthase (NADPH/NADH) large chain/glutamate synthase (ferredoxin)
MSGGLAYVLDESGQFESRCNRAMVTLHRLEAPEEIKSLRGLIYRHLELTDSARAKEILDDWTKFEPLFWKVVPLPPALPGTPLAPNNVPVAPTPADPAKA